MLTAKDLFVEVDRLTASEKLQLIKHMLDSLEPEYQDQSDETEYHRILRETYGSLRDTPLKRWDQGEYEERERFD